MNGHIGAGLYMAATFGLAREYPELNAFVNDNGRRLSLIYRDQCSDFLSYSGIFMIDQDWCGLGAAVHLEEIPGEHTLTVT